MEIGILEPCTDEAGDRAEESLADSGPNRKRIEEMQVKGDQERPGEGQDQNKPDNLILEEQPELSPVHEEIEFEWICFQKKSPKSRRVE